MKQLIGIHNWYAMGPEAATSTKPPEKVSKSKHSLWSRVTRKKAAAITPIKSDMPVVPKERKVGKVKKAWKVIREEFNNAKAAFAMGRGYSSGECGVFMHQDGDIPPKEGRSLRELASQKAAELKAKCEMVKCIPSRIKGRFMIFVDS